MNHSKSYRFNLPPEEEVIKRNRTITTYYAQLYKSEPILYKWAGMAAFASFHIGKKMEMWDWHNSGIKPFSLTCGKESRSIEDDFQIIRAINNKIFTEIGRLHLRFGQMEYESFKAVLITEGKHLMIINAFEKLNHVKASLLKQGHSNKLDKLIWEANIEILWHEQAEVVQPMFDKLSNLFSRAMTLFASFDYKVNHLHTKNKVRSRFILFIIFRGFWTLQKNWFIPEVTNLDQRWVWISQDILKKWQQIEEKKSIISLEIDLLAQLEKRRLSH